MRRPRTLLLLALLLPGATLASPTVRSTQLSTDHVKLGEPFSWKLVVTGSGAAWKAQPLTGSSPFTVLGQTTTHGKDDAVVQLQLALYEVGPHPLPSLTLTAPDGAKLTVPGDGQVTAVSTLAKGDQQLRGLAGPVVPTVLSWKRVALGVGLLLGAGLLLALLARAAVRLWRKQASQEKRDLRALNTLLHSVCTDDAFYSALDGIVRRQLALRHAIPAPERTSGELSRLPLPLPELNRLFQEADRVKFAERPATPGQRDADVQLARQLFVSNRPSPGGPRAPAALP